MKKSTKRIVFYIVLIGLIAALAYGITKPIGNNEYANLGELINDVKSENIISLKVNESGKCTVKTAQGATKTYTFTSMGYQFFTSQYAELLQDQLAAGKLTELDFTRQSGALVWLSYWPYIFMAVIMIILVVIYIRSASGKGGAINNFGKARTKMGVDEKKRVLFRDVAGADEEKEELQEVVDYLRDPSKYVKLGARIPHGVLLVGPPGTGKTLLAKAVAGEAGAPFFSISGSDFVEMYVGVGASRVRDLFENAKKFPASIIFIDEIDAVGRHRGAGLGGGHDEREQTLNQLLVEMDGFGTGNAVIVIAATNRPDILDPALLRPGRFDRRITVGYPDIKGRLDILKIHAQGKPFENTVSLENVAKSCVGFTGADLANLLNEAALLAARRGKLLIGEREIEDALIKVVVGTEKRSKVIREEEKRTTAYHEGGHAIITYLLQPEDQVHQISVIPTGQAGGYTIHRPVEDRMFMSKTQMKNEIVSLLAGRVAEKIVFNDINNGASSDIQRATSIARNMVMRYGMSERLGSVVFGSGHSDDEIFLGRDMNTQKNYSESTAAVIDNEIHSIISEAYEVCEKLLRENIDKLHFVAEYLVKNEVMNEHEFESLMKGEVSTVEELEKIRDERKKLSESENAEKAKREEAERRRREEEERRRLNELSGIMMPPFGQNKDDENKQ